MKMKKVFFAGMLMIAGAISLHAQQSFSSFPANIDKAEYDDREAVFVTDESGESGLFLSDNSMVHFVKLDEAGNAVTDLKQNMPLNYNSLKRAGVGTLEGMYYCYFLLGNKKLTVLQADVNSGKLSYIPFPLPNEKDPVVCLAAGQGYLYIVTASAEAKNEWNVYKYTKPMDPVVSKLKTDEVDLYKTLGITTNKAVEQIAVLPMNGTVHFTQDAYPVKLYHNADQLLLCYDAPMGETKVWSLEASQAKSYKSDQVLEKKSIFKSVVYNGNLYQLTVSSTGVAVKITNIQTGNVVGESPAEPDFLFESSYSSRIGYNKERKAAVQEDLIKSFYRSDNAGLGLMESANGKLLLVAGLSNKNNITDPSIENSDSDQKGGLSVNMIMERNYSDLHLPSYAADQYALLRFKSDIWVYTYWVLDPNTGKLSKAMPEDLIALDEGLDLYYRDPLNNAAPAVWHLNKAFVFGYYATKNQQYNLYKISGKQAGANMNRR